LESFDKANAPVWRGPHQRGGARLKKKVMGKRPRGDEGKNKPKNRIPANKNYRHKWMSGENLKKRTKGKKRNGKKTEIKKNEDCAYIGCNW